MTDRRPYHAVDHESPEGHAVDRAIERRLPLKKLRRRIRRATHEMHEALGEHADLWLRLEPLLGELRALREEAYFDLGYEHGLTAGRAEALRALADAATARTTTGDARAFADVVRDLAVQSDLPLPLTVAALLETAWALALGLSDHPATPNHRRT